MAALAETRAADLHNAAARARHDGPPTPSVPLDAYPRLCGLPVTIDRLTAQPEPAATAPADQAAPEPVRGRRLSLRFIGGRRRRRLALTRQ